MKTYWYAESYRSVVQRNQSRDCLPPLFVQKVTDQLSRALQRGEKGKSMKKKDETTKGCYVQYERHVNTQKNQ
jgi:hypothetical protein